MKDNYLQAVHDDDLSALLASLGVLDRVNNNEYTCRFCGESITMNNIGAILPVNGGIAFSCDSPGCLKNMAEVGEIDDG